MNSLFILIPQLDKIYISFILIGITCVISFLFNFILSFRLRATKSFFVTSLIMPLIVTAIISMVSIFLDSAVTGVVRIATIAVALGLIRFRSVNGRAEEILVLFAGVAYGLICGLGYAAFAAIFALFIALLYFGLNSVNIFKNKRFGNEKMLKITIPESLEYNEAFDDVFVKYLKTNELVGVKTTNMGSMFILSYKIELKDSKQEKALIDDLRVRNANLEISILPYIKEDKDL